jgi:hypothetical protein
MDEADISVLAVSASGEGCKCCDNLIVAGGGVIIKIDWRASRCIADVGL